MYLYCSSLKLAIGMSSITLYGLIVIVVPHSHLLGQITEAFVILRLRDGASLQKVIQRFFWRRYSWIRFSSGEPFLFYLFHNASIMPRIISIFCSKINRRVFADFVNFLEDLFLKETFFGYGRCLQPLNIS